MLKNQNIICISSIDWDFVWQGHQEIMSAFARAGNRVLFIENTGIRTPTFKDISRLRKRIGNWAKSTKGFRKAAENLYLYSPIVLPFPYSSIARWVNRRLLLEPLKRWLRAADFRDPIIWTFLPTGIALDIMEAVDYKLLVYYYIADFGALTDNPASLKKTEEAVIRKSDVIFVQGETLKRRCEELGKDATVFPFGVNNEIFERYLESSAKNIPADMSSVKKPLIGYIGGIHKHIDLELVRYVAEKHPEWSIVMVGPKQADVSTLEGVSNIHFLGQKDFAELPSYVYRFDACIIPYLLSDYTNTVYPTKLNEYHIMGKPVISTCLPEVEKFNRDNDGIVGIAKDKDAFVSLVEGALKAGDAELVQKRITSARKHGWGARVESMSDIMQKSIDARTANGVNWQERFLSLYKNTKRRVWKAVLAAAFMWAMVFYTPLVWMVAQPLVIAQAPEKADAIVVLAGGVGESGKAGQGYEERVGYGVELYKQGYARHLIFSSGYKSFFDETMLMKALAIALGVPESAIILEDKAKNTHENIVFAEDIIRKKGWRNALLVSSPYHMRRVALVVNKADDGINFIYTPIPNSAFYSHQRGLFSKKIGWDQIEAIAHEYIGILYYWWKGWV